MANPDEDLPFRLAETAWNKYHRQSGNRTVTVSGETQLLDYDCELSITLSSKERKWWQIFGGKKTKLKVVLEDDGDREVQKVSEAGIDSAAGMAVRLRGMAFIAYGKRHEYAGYGGI